MGSTWFGVLGPVAARRDGAPVPLGGPKPRALLATLLLHHGRRVPVDTLIDALWGAAAPATAVKTVQKYAWYLRRQLGAPVIASVPGGYAIAAGEVDAERFERTADEGDTALRAGDPGRAAALLTDALALWRGEPYADVGDLAAAYAERRRLQERHLAAVVALADARLALGEHRALVGWLEELVARHPLQERLWAQLMTALYASGRQADALAAYRRLRDVLVDQLGVEPAPEVRRLHERILRHQEPAPAARPPVAGNVPHRLTSFLGRAGELAEITALLRGHRLVTLTGPGGSGKTRLALELADRLGSAHPDGAWLVELATLTARTHIAPAVAAALRLGEQPGRQVADVLGDHLATRRLLLVLDNAEHLADEVAEFAHAALRHAPGLRVLATSRRPLGVDGEVRFEVGPLPVPTDPDGRDLDASDAGRLLVERARAGDRHFAAPAATAAALARICRQLDGMPLALELAAARLRALDAQRVADLLDDRFRLLVSTLRTAPARHQTLRAAVDWSYDLLTADERLLFRRLSVFAGGFGLEAAEQVCAGPPLRPAAVLTLLVSLVDQSLVVAERRPDGDTRYRLLETLRAYGRARLEPGESGAVHRRHLDFLHELVARAEVELHGPDQARWLDRLDAERDNLRAALRWALAHGAVDAAARLIALQPSYWDLRSQFSEAAMWLSEALGRSGELAPALRAEVLAGAAQIALARGDHDEAADLARQGSAAFAAVADPLGAARCAMLLGLASLYQGEYARAAELFDGCLAEFGRLGRTWERASVLGRLGQLARLQGDYPRARDRFVAALALCREVGDTGTTGWTLWQLGVLARYEGDTGRARGLCLEALDIFERLGDSSGLAHVRYTLGDLARLDDASAEALRLYQDSLAALRDHGDQRCIASTLTGLAMVRLGAGDAGQAGRHLRESLAVRRAVGDRAGVAECLEKYASVELARGDAARAAWLLGAAAQLREETGAARPASDEREYAVRVATARELLTPAEFREAWDVGRAAGGAAAGAAVLAAEGGYAGAAGPGPAAALPAGAAVPPAEAVVPPAEAVVPPAEAPVRRADSTVRQADSTVRRAAAGDRPTETAASTRPSSTSAPAPDSTARQAAQ